MLRNVMAIDNGKIIGIPSAASGVSYDNTDSGLTSTNVQDAIDEVSGELSDKVDKVAGKGLSTNDYTNADKAIVDGVTSALAGKVDKVVGKGLSTNDYDDTAKGIVNGVTSALAGKADVSSVPTKTSDLTNDSGFITNLVNNLLNYYLKTETYSKSEVDALLQAITTLDIQAVSQLPTTNISTTTIYLVPKQDPQVPDVKDEYINLDGTTSGWELIGNTQIDLSNYVTTSDLTTALQSYATKTYVDGLIGDLSALTTTDKSSAVGAINEVNGKLTKMQTVANIDPTYKHVVEWNIIKQGNICTLSMWNLKDIPNGSTNIGTIPDGFRPEMSFYEYVYSANKDVHLGFNFMSNGVIQVINPTGATLSGDVYLNRNVTYFTA